MTIDINVDSISSLVGSVISLTFTIYFLISYLIVKKKRLYIILSLFMCTHFLLMIGFSLYTSSYVPTSVLFWTKIFFAGGVLISYTGFLLSSEIIHRDSKLLNNVILLLVLLLLIIIFLPTELLFTGEINPEKSHSSIIKGPFFPYLLMIIYSVDLLLLVRFIRGLIQNHENRYLIAPILFGLLFWFGEAIFGGIFGALLSLVDIKFTFGSIIFTFSLAIYSGRLAEQKNTELVRIKEENKQIHNSLIYDKLSTLYSRQYFSEALEQRSALNARESLTDCLMFIDVDNFKSVNDKLGHSHGDDLITYVGETLWNNSRKSDICARYGGDEFLILLENCKTEDARIIAEKISLTFKEKLSNVLNNWKGCQNVTLSIGIVSSHFWSNDTTEIIKKADLAMYESKRKGRNTIMFFSESMEL